MVHSEEPTGDGDEAALGEVLGDDLGQAVEDNDGDEVGTVGAAPVDGHAEGGFVLLAGSGFRVSGQAAYERQLVEDVAVLLGEGVRFDGPGPRPGKTKGQGTVSPSEDTETQWRPAATLAAPGPRGGCAKAKWT